MAQTGLAKGALQPPGREPRKRRWAEAAAALAVFLLAAAFLYRHAPVAGDFAWSDAPRHALNGIFVHDLLAALPVADPRAFAVDYYLRYPALTILFYPPLFYGVLALAYAALGFSHPVAQGTVLACAAAMGWLYFCWARRYLPPLWALAAGLLLIGAPEITVWGRQVMLDIPAYAWLVAMVLAFTRYLDQRGPRALYASVLLFAAALYTKQTPLFVAPALAMGLMALHGRQVLRRREIWLAALLGVVLLAPLVLLQLKFGQVNSASLLGKSEREDLPRQSIAAWTYYASVLPTQLGWPTLLLSLAYLAGCLRWPAWRLPRAHMAFLLAWLVIGYLFFSFIMVREPRHDLMVLLPLPLFAVLAVRQLVQGSRLGASAAVAVLVLALGTLAWSATERNVPFVRGYRDAAHYVQQQAPPDSVVLFSGNLDGTFIFNMRAGSRRDLRVARADKLLFRVSIERARGIQDRQLEPERIADLIMRHGVRYVVYDPDFWQDLPSMAALNTLLGDTSKFVLEREIATVANFKNADRRIRIYRSLGPLKSPPDPLGAELVGVGTQLQAP